jgi:hypothetical protein
VPGSYSGRLKTSKTGSAGLFPRFLGVERFLRLKIEFFMPHVGSISIQNGLDRHHHALPNPPVRRLLSDRPFGRLPCQPLPICVHKSPRSVKKAPDNFDGARVKAFARDFLCLIKPSFIDLSVSMFAPTPVL